MRRLVLLLLLFAVAATSACREQTKEELLQQGKEFAAAGNYQAASTLFKNALDKDPNYSDARMQLGVAYLKTNKLDKAENELDKVLLQDPDNFSVSLLLAEIYVGTNRPERAIQRLEKLRGSNPDNLESLRILAQSHAMLGDLPLAEELFRKALTIDPNHATTQLGLAQLLYFAGRNDEGHALVNEVIKREPANTEAYYLLVKRALNDRDRNEAVTNLEKIRSLNSEDILAAYLLGMLYLDLEKVVDARQIAADLKTRKPGHPAGYRIDGVALYLNGDYEAAIQNLQKSLNGMPDLPGFYFLGLASYRFGQLEQALSSFQKALDKNPDHEQSRLMVAQTLFKQGHVDDCMNQVKIVLEKDPESASAHNLLGSVFLVQGKYDLALEQIDRAIQINPELAQAHLKKGLFNLASGNKKQGELDLSNAVNAAPEVLNTRLLLATYYLRQHNYPQALQVLEKGLTIAPDSALIYNLLAAVKFGQNNPQAAVESLKKAKKLKPDFFTPYNNLANYYITRKDYQAALLEYQDVLQIDPGHVAAMLKTAALHELMGEDALALSFYERAAKTQNAQGYLALASFQLRKGKNTEATQTLKAGYDSQPDNVELLAAYGEALKSTGQFDQALLVYAHLEDLRPGNGIPHLLIVHLLKGDFAAAKEIADHAIAESPDSANGYLFQAAIYEKQSKPQLAEQALQKGIAATGNSLQLRIELARLYLRRDATDNALNIYDQILREKPNLVPVLFSKAAIYDQAGDKKQAQHLYETILSLDEHYAPALNNLALLLIDVYADNKRALELASTCFRLHPNDSRIIDTLGYALLKNSQIDKSILFLEKAASISPQEPAIQIHLARAYKAAGRKEDAIASLSAISEQQAHKGQLQEVRALMNELN